MPYEHSRHNLRIDHAPYQPLVPMVTALLLSTVPGHHIGPPCIRTNQKFHYKFSAFECMKIAQNYAQVSLPLPHTIQYSKIFIFCWKALFH